MYKIIVIPTLLLLFVFHANNFLFASENPESNIGEGIEAVAGAKIEEKVGEAAAAVVEVEAPTSSVADADVKADAKVVEATAVVEEAEAKVEESVTSVIKAGEQIEETVESSESEVKIVEGIEAVEAKVEASTGIGETALNDGEAKVKDNAAAVVEVEEKVEETSAAAVADAEPEGSSEAVEENETDVIAIVNGEKIIRKDFDKRLNVFRRLNQDVTRPIKMQVIDQLTKRLLLKQFVEGQNIEVGDDEVQGELEKIKYFLENNPNNTDKPLDEILETQGSSITELENEVKRTLALSKYLEKTVSDENKQSYFNANKNAFNGARVKASHVLIDTRGMKTEAELEEAKKMIEVVKIEIDKGADFAEMAKKYSNCPSANKGGDIGFFQRKGSIVEEFAKVAFSMGVGEISAPVKTQFGYHIIKVTEKEEGQDVSYEEVADMVDFVFMQMKTESILKELYEKAKIEIFI
jgi:parvulin-like peptidyl-prolyl isomerase